MEPLRFILVQQTLENKTTVGINSNDKPKDSAFAIILFVIIVSIVGFSLYFFGSDKQTDRGNFFTNLRDKFQDWLEQQFGQFLGKRLKPLFYRWHRRVRNPHSTVATEKLPPLSIESKCDALRRELLRLVQHQEEVADRLINNAKSQYPGNTERWYLEKVIYDLERDR